VFKVMGNFGSRLFFLALHTPTETDDELIAQNLGEDRKHRETVCKAATESFLQTLWANSPGGVTWNKAGDPRECLRVIAKCSRLLAHLRGAINVWSVGEDDEKLSHSVPVIEKPNRINCLLYNLARGHALVCGRRQLTLEDLWPVLDLTFDSAPTTRAKVFRALIERGALTTTDVVELLRCSPPTARKEIEALVVLGVANKDSCPDKAGLPETAITLDERFEWFTSTECHALIKTPVLTESVYGSADTQLKSFQLANVSGGVQQLKENLPCVTVSGGSDARRRLLSGLVAAIQAERGLHPAGHPDCQWGDDYPAQYVRALDYVANDGNDERRTFDRLASLTRKVEHEAANGRPLTTGPGGCEWREGFFPEAFIAARAYVREQMDKRERELLGV
jgi:hypothetical protein